VSPIRHGPYHTNRVRSKFTLASVFIASERELRESRNEAAKTHGRRLSSLCPRASADALTAKRPESAPELGLGKGTKQMRSYIFIRTERGKQDVRTHLPQDKALPVDAIHWCEA